MTSIRKLKRRAMVRLSDPVVELRLPEDCLVYFSNMTSIDRENHLRQVLKGYVDWHQRRKPA